MTIVPPRIGTDPVLAFESFFEQLTVDEHTPTAAFLADFRASEATLDLVLEVTAFSVMAPGFDAVFASAGSLRALPAARRLRGCLSQTLAEVVQSLAEVAEGLGLVDTAAAWQRLASGAAALPAGRTKLADALLTGPLEARTRRLLGRLERGNPHALYPTSAYRESDGAFSSTDDGRVVEATMTSRTFTSVRITDDVLDPGNPLLARVYAPLGRCVALVDQNVHESCGTRLADYFATHGVALDAVVVRAMEVDKSIRTVERILGALKDRAVSRQEPVLVVGGGVLADIGGLACALYHRNTPYVMLGTSIVSGIDAGPSPRTCCDGFGYKNLFGAYHAPILSITDRGFFASLRPGWLRHGLAEIVKMAVVKDLELFELLEGTDRELVETRFATTGGDARLRELSNRILGRAMASYVEAEYGNLYETHQCRPHAYGHTWSPGFEITAGLLHGHAVSIGMGFGAFLSHRQGWIGDRDLERIVAVIRSFDLSLWHDVLDDEDLLWRAQQKIVAKRGGNLAAPLPRTAIGACGYLNELDRDGLVAALRAYRTFCSGLPDGGRGVEPHCADVGLEDPGTVFVERGEGENPGGACGAAR